MPVVISMLRGVNVGGHNLIKMDPLRALYESLGLQDPATYVQSGNVIFKTKERDVARLAPRIQNEIERRFGFRPGVILRTSSDLRDVIKTNPFAHRDLDPSKLLVTFLATDPAPDARKALLRIKPDPEELRYCKKLEYRHPAARHGGEVGTFPLISDLAKLRASSKRVTVSASAIAMPPRNS